MDTSCYARCADCDEIKALAADGVLHDHTRFRADGTSVIALRCPGSGHRPPGAAADRTAPDRPPRTPPPPPAGRRPDGAVTPTLGR